jgi:hypothetical protein
MAATALRDPEPQRVDHAFRMVITGIAESPSGRIEHPGLVPPYRWHILDEHSHRAQNLCRTRHPAVQGVPRIRPTRVVVEI